jgi:dihydropteroate synthase
MPIAAQPLRFSTPVPLTLGEHHYDLARTALVMGVVNRTKDSFYDHGAYFRLDDALQLTEKLVLAGADIIDVGGVRAGPGPEVSAAEEIDRVLPAVEAIHARFAVPISVDTWRAEVADASFRAGAVLGNDISGFADPDYLAVAARHGASVVGTHIRLRPRVDDPDPHYPDDDVVSAVEQYLLERVRWARRAGLRTDQVILDAGLDLGKTTPQSLLLLGASDRLARLGQPLLLSASNKGFLGELLALEIDKRHDATLAALALGVTLGCRVLRVHDVAAAGRVVRTLAALADQ